MIRTGTFLPRKSASSARYVCCIEKNRTLCCRLATKRAIKGNWKLHLRCRGGSVRAPHNRGSGKRILCYDRAERSSPEGWRRIDFFGKSFYCVICTSKQSARHGDNFGSCWGTRTQPHDPPPPRLDFLGLCHRAHFAGWEVQKRGSNAPSATEFSLSQKRSVKVCVQIRLLQDAIGRAHACLSVANRQAGPSENV